MSENTLLKAIFANRLTDHGRVAAQLQETLNELEQHDLFGFMCNGENEKVFGVWRQKLHALLVSKVASARFAALWLATASVRRCGYEFLVAVVDDWSTLAFATINRTEPDNVQAAALMLVATLVERCCLWSELRRRVTASGGEAARLVTALLLRLEAPAALKPAILPVLSNALALLLRSAPAAARHSVERLARALFALLPSASSEERLHVAACLALLPMSIRASTASNAADSAATTAAGGEWTPSAATGDAQSMMALRAVALAHDTLDAALACVAEPADSARLRVELSAVGAQRHWLPPLPVTHAQRRNQKHSMNIATDGVDTFMPK